MMNAPDRLCANRTGLEVVCGDKIKTASAL